MYQDQVSLPCVLWELCIKPGTFRQCLWRSRWRTASPKPRAPGEQETGGNPYRAALGSYCENDLLEASYLPRWKVDCRCNPQ